MCSLKTVRCRSERGFISFDALFSMVPVLLMILLATRTAATLSERAQEAAHRQQVFDKLVSVADFTVKSGAVRRDGALRYPNWLDPAALTPAYTRKMMDSTGLPALSISVGPPQDGYQMCIYRLVAVGDSKEIRRLSVCGG